MSGTHTLSFIHISDIHFVKSSNDPYDIDDELREAMLNDIKDYGKLALNINGILVCGDIAFSGQEEEYEIAIDFLNRVAKLCGVENNDIYCVPGNHDVNQLIAKKSRVLELAQDDLVSVKSADELDKKIRSIQLDSIINVDNGLLYKPIEMYNQFFQSMSCNFTVDKPNWQTPIPLNDQYKLIIYGMNSTLTSNYKDHLDDKGNKRKDGTERKMIINRKQIPNFYNDSIYLSLCHHPPDCWNDSRLEELMDERVKIQLYGHKHIQNIDASEKRIRIGSGALHPERGDDWIPRYNWLEIWIEKDTLCVRIYPRIFNNKKGIFIPDTKSCDDGFEFKMCRLNLSNEDNNDVVETEISTTEVRETTLITKEIVYLFSVLSDSNKILILQSFPEVTYDISQGIEILLEQLKQHELEDKFLEKLRKE